MARAPESGERGGWYPLFGAWFRESSFQHVQELRAGLESVGVQTRVDEFGAGDCRVELIRAWTPEPVGERAERWLAELARPFEDGAQWAVSLSLLPFHTDDLVVVWSGSWEEFERFGVPGHSFAAMGGGPSTNFCCLQRGGPTLLDRLPGWRLSHGERLEEGEESRWLVLDRDTADGVAEVDAVLEAVQNHGLTTCCYEDPDAGTLLAFVDSGVGGCIEDLEPRIRQALEPLSERLRGRFVPWSWSRKVVVRMFPEPAGLWAREWLQDALDGVHVDCVGGEAIALQVPVAFVDRAIERLDYWEQHVAEHL